MFRIPTRIVSKKVPSLFPNRLRYSSVFTDEEKAVIPLFVGGGLGFVGAVACMIDEKMKTTKQKMMDSILIIPFGTLGGVGFGWIYIFCRPIILPILPLIPLGMLGIYIGDKVKKKD